MAALPIENYAFALINDSPDLIGFALINEPFRRVYVNPAGLAMVGLGDVDEWNAHDIADMFDDADVRHFLERVIPALKEGKTWAEEADIRNVRTGSKTRVHRRMFPIFDPETEGIMAFGTICRDITELKSAQKDAQAAQESLAVREERERIARDLHDSTLQQLISINYEVEALKSQLDPAETPGEVLKRLDNITRVAQEAITEARHTLAAIRSVRFAGGSNLEEALRAEIKAKAALAGYRADLIVEGETRELNADVQDVMLRIVQESLTNSWKHGKAQNVAVTLRFSHGRVVLEVCDDGMGFDPDDAGPRLTGYNLGLSGMKERAQTVSAELSVRSASGAGCTITLTVPD